MSTLQSILIVDDQLDNLKLLSDLLKENYRVQAVSSGKKALALLNHSPPPDLFLLDIMMPEMNGYELCQRIKARPETAQIPVVFLTAKNDSDSEMRGFQVGAVDYVTKPVHPPMLMARVSAHLALAMQRQQLQNERDLGQRVLQQSQRTANAMAVVTREYEAQRLQQLLILEELPQLLDHLLTAFDDLPINEVHRNTITKIHHLKQHINQIL